MEIERDFLGAGSHRTKHFFKLILMYVSSKNKIVINLYKNVCFKHYDFLKNDLKLGKHYID